VPVAPFNPDVPFGPVDPLRPIGPVVPVAPFIPVTPIGPVDPLTPIGPVGPLLGIELILLLNLNILDIFKFEMFIIIELWKTILQTLQTLQKRQFKIIIIYNNLLRQNIFT